MIDRRARLVPRIAVLIAAAGLPACASGGSVGAGAASRLMPASYAFEFSVPSVRRSRGMVEPYEYVVRGEIAVDTGTTLRLVRLGRSPADRVSDCRINVARQLIRAGATLDINCQNVRLQLEHLNGEIVGGGGFAQVQTIQASTYQCEDRAVDPRTGQRTCRQWSPTERLELAWKEGRLWLERF